jgi:FixJ family two-component response regulator
MNSWNVNIEMHLKERKWGSVDWIHPPQDRDQCQAVVNRVINLLIP